MTGSAARTATSRLTTRLRQPGLGQLLDIVPNHMALHGRANAWWWDVLENGPASRYAGYFDIDWDPPERKLTATVLMPILADRYGRVLEAGRTASQARRRGSFVVSYADQEAAAVAAHAWTTCWPAPPTPAGSAELKAIATDLGNLPHAILTDAAAVAERHEGSEELRRKLAELRQDRADLAAAIDAEVEAINADPDRLDELLSGRTTGSPTGARPPRSCPTAGSSTSTGWPGCGSSGTRSSTTCTGLVAAWSADGSLDGLRIDHVDGLADPEGYLTRLRAAVGDDAYIVVEKILGPDEELPGSWPVAGTSGYGFLNLVSQLFVDPAGEQEPCSTAMPASPARTPASPTSATTPSSRSCPRTWPPRSSG